MVQDVLPGKAHTVNPRTRRAHRLQVVGQIFLPLLAGILLGGAGLFLLLNANVGNVERAAQFSTVLLAIPFVVIGLILFFLLVFLIFALGRLMHWIPPQTYRVQRLAHGVSSRAVRGANLLTEPVLFIESWAGALGDLVSRRREKMQP